MKDGWITSYELVSLHVLLRKSVLQRYVTIYYLYKTSERSTHFLVFDSSRHVLQM
jgi:hypothetical protein